ncbi:MAG: SH3 domain-containing protein [Anaerolineales bacterium]|nr:SH3 domain-containing protein [Anaerolineales bacterium]
MNAIRKRPISSRITIALVVAALLIIAVIQLPQQKAAAQEGQNLPWNELSLGAVTGPAGTLFYFDGTAGDSVSIEVNGISGFIPSIFLLDANKAPLAQELNAANTSAAILNATLFNTGLYYVQINGVNNSVGQFTILLKRGLPPGIPLPLDIETQGLLAPSLPVVYYDFQLNPTGPTQLEVRSMTEGYSPLVTVLDPNGEVVATLTSTHLVGVTLEFGPGEGTYKLAVDLGEFAEPVEFSALFSNVIPDSETPPTSNPPQTGPSTTQEANDGSSTICRITPDGDGANVRAGGSTEHDTVGFLAGGQYAQAIGYNPANGSWYEIILPNNVRGWIASFVVTTTGPCNTLSVTTYPAVGSSGGSSGGSGSPTATRTPTATGSPESTDEPDDPTATQPSGPTATYTPSYTPTTPPPPPTAPPDTTSLPPLNIPLDETASATDYVSYPNGDTQDKISWNVTGMNPNVALPGGRARLVITATCFGTGTEYITFFTTGQTYSCGQTIVDREVTYDSRTGLVTIDAIGGSGTYVQWVLTATATRLN